METDSRVVHLIAIISEDEKELIASDKTLCGEAVKGWYLAVDSKVTCKECKKKGKQAGLRVKTITEPDKQYFEDVSLGVCLKIKALQKTNRSKQKKWCSEDCPFYFSRPTSSPYGCRLFGELYRDWSETGLNASRMLICRHNNCIEMEKE